MTGPSRTAVYPGSFNPPTIAHLAIAEAARQQRGVDRVVWMVSGTALAKESVEHPRFRHRIEVLQEVCATLPWLEVEVTSHQLLADIASGFDLIIMGADKWEQIQDPHWYGSGDERDRALARLPEVAVAPRPPASAPTEITLDVDPGLTPVSSSRALAGEHDDMLPAARAFAERTGAWIDTVRYERWADP